MNETRKKVIRNLLASCVEYTKTRGGRVVSIDFATEDVIYMIEAIDKDRKVKGNEYYIGLKKDGEEEVKNSD